MRGTEQPMPLGGRAAHQRFGAAVLVGEDPAALLWTDRPLPNRRV
jgi:hypothetical protein